MSIAGELPITEPMGPGEARRVEAFLRLTRLERGLRAMLNARLPEIDGPKWWKALPPDIREGAREPDLAFVDFPDLKKIIGSKWNHLGSVVDRYSKEQVIVHLEELEGIRNDIAHSRDV